MPDDRPTISSSRVAAADVARHSFDVVRRGFDPQEVRAYLELVSRELSAWEQHDDDLRQQLADAEERSRHPVIDEATLTAALGQQSAALLRHAHDEAARITQTAEEAAATLTREAQQHATEAMIRAESSAAERIAEAEIAATAVQQEAGQQVATRLDAARAEGEALVERARQQGRAMIDQAQDARRRVLADMAQRRRAITLQIEQFRAARDELAAAVLGLRDNVDRVVGDLVRADDDARAAAADVARRQPTDMTDTVVAAEVNRAVADLDAAGPVFDADEFGPPSMPAPPSPPAPEPAAEVSPAAAGPSAPDEAPVGEAGSGTEAGLDTGLVDTGLVDTGRVVAVPIADPVTVVSADLGGHGVDPDIERAEVDAVEDLFARLRASHPGDGEGDGDGGREPPSGTEASDTDVEESGGTAPEDAAAEPVADAEEAEVGDVEAAAATGTGGPSEAAEPPEAGSTEAGSTEAAATAAAAAAAAAGATTGGSGGRPDAAEAAATNGAETGDEVEGAGEAEDGPDQAALARRAELLDPVVAKLARRLKRALQDDQNRLLDGLRSGSGDRLGAVMTPEDDQQSAYVEAASADLRDAAVAGVSFARQQLGTTRGRAPAPDAAAIADVASNLAGTIVTLLRRRLSDENATGSEAADRVGAAYREWRGARIERLVGDAALEAFSTGVISGAGPAGLRWVLAGTGTGCADCDDNALAGVVARGDEFPTGHRHPPAHAGCRCLVVPTPV